MLMSLQLNQCSPEPSGVRHGTLIFGFWIKQVSRVSWWRLKGGGNHWCEEDAQRLRKDFVKKINPSTGQDGEVQGEKRVAGDS
eukprot:11724505-Heterocapsa_arctica.AAC.1